MNSKKVDPELAKGWRAARVQSCLEQGEKRQLLDFLRRRFEDRFFEPIRTLRQARRNTQGYAQTGNAVSIGTLFAERLEKAFHLYLRELNGASWDDPLWKKTQRKIWWLIRFSRHRS